MFMIRFLFFVLAIVGVYVLSNVFTVLHEMIYVNYAQYTLEISAGFAVLCVIVFCVILSYIFRILGAIISLPSTISEHLARSNEKKTLNHILGAYADIITGRKYDASIVMKNIKKKSGDKYKEHISLILSQSAKNFDQTMYHLRELAEVPEYSYFASKQLAYHYLYHGYNQQAFECLNQAIRLYNNDIELLKLMLKTCSRLELWSDLHDYVQKLQKVEKSLSIELKQEIAQYYLNAVSYFLSEEDDRKALQYAKYALEHDPKSLDAIETYCWLCNNKGDLDSIHKIVSNAFAITPSFELFFIYHSSLEGQSAESLYERFAELVSPLNHPSVFIAIASYLGLEKEVESMRHIMDVRN